LRSPSSSVSTWSAALSTPRRLWALASGGSRHKSVSRKARKERKEIPVKFFFAFLCELCATSFFFRSESILKSNGDTDRMSHRAFALVLASRRSHRDLYSRSE